jgi:hypothetical protein
MILSLLLCLLLSPAHAVDTVVEGPREIAPAGRNFIFSRTKDGMLVRLPTFDTDPNIGPTFGFVAVWVIGSDSSTIKSIHAPSVNYNNHFGVTGTYQYFHFPNRHVDISARASLSQYWNREAIAEYEEKDFRDTGATFDGRFEHSRDGAKRFYGIGPNTSIDGVSNYTFDTINYYLIAGVPLAERSPWSFKIRHALQADEVEGSFPPIPDTVQLYPGVTQGLQYRRINVSNRAYIVYDTRDNADTTTLGTYGEAFIGGSRTDLLSAYNYTRYGAMLKTFLPIGDPKDVEPRYITAMRVEFENLNGNAPFFLLPELGGKYSLRSYGDGRFYDHSLIDLSLEQRCRVYTRKISGIPVSFWIDPFVGLGGVAPEPDRFQRKYLHPAFGTAFRVVSRPQVVESLDFGYGQEGLKVFLDVKYSY